MVQRLFRKPVQPQAAQRQAAPEPATAPLALPFGSPSERGTVYLAPAPKSAQLPPGSATDRLESAPFRLGKTSSTRSGGEKAEEVAPAPVPARQGIARRLASKAGELRNRRERSRIEGSSERRARQVRRDSARCEKSKANKNRAERKGAVKPVAAQAATYSCGEHQSSQEKKGEQQPRCERRFAEPSTADAPARQDAELGDGFRVSKASTTWAATLSNTSSRAPTRTSICSGAASLRPAPSCRLAPTGPVAGRAKYAALQRNLHDLRDCGRRCRVWIDHKLIIDGWGLHGVLEYAADVKFEANKQYNIRVDYFESGGPPAAIGLYWESPSQKKEFVPQDRLFYPLAGSKRELEKDEKP
jgi:hypothetical protein